MFIRPSIAVFLGAGIVALAGHFVARPSGERIAEELTAESRAALDAAGAPAVSARFTNGLGSPTRHPVLTGGEGLNEGVRLKAAQTVAAIPGVGGVSWIDGVASAANNQPVYEPLHCQKDVEGLLRVRSIRFEEASSALVPASRVLIDEVADALRPCLGSIIAITGHTDDSGTPVGNLQLSLERARSVREELVRRGIPRDGLRARGLGSKEPVEGLAPSDPANRRIEFSVIRTEPITPHPVDLPGAR